MDLFPFTSLFRLSSITTILLPDLIVWVARRLFYMKRELFTLREHIDSSVFGDAHSAFGHIFVVFCVVFFVLFCRSVSCAQCCPCLSILSSWSSLWFSLTFTQLLLLNCCLFVCLAFKTFTFYFSKVTFCDRLLNRHSERKVWRYQKGNQNS